MSARGPPCSPSESRVEKRWVARRRRRPTALSWGRPPTGLVCQRSSVLLDVGRTPGSLQCPGPSLTDRSPAPCGARSSRPGRAPLQSRVTTSRPSGLSAGADSPGVSAPFNDTTRTSPVVERVIDSRPGSALRFSQPLSGLLARPSFAALFHAAAVPGLPPTELSPRRDRAPLSGPLASLPSSTRVPERTSRGLSPPVSLDAHARRRGGRAPPTTMASLSTSRSPLPGLPGPRAVGTAPYRWLHRLRSLVPPDESVLPRLELPLTAGVAALLDVLPLQRLSCQPSEPRPARPRRPDTRPAPEGSGPRLRGLHDPPQRTAPPATPGRTFPQLENPGSIRSAVSGPLRDRPAPSLDGDSFSLGLRSHGYPRAPTLGASK
jgi:hypothetical protein